MTLRTRTYTICISVNTQITFSESRIHGHMDCDLMIHSQVDRWLNGWIDFWMYIWAGGDSGYMATYKPTRIDAVTVLPKD